MYFLHRLFWLVLIVAAVVGTQIKAKSLEVDVETNWCPSNKLKDGETCPVEFVVKNNEVKTIQVYLSPTNDHSRLFLRRLIKAPFKINFKFKGSGELRLLLITLDKDNKLVGLKEEVIDIDKSQGWVLGDQDSRSIWELQAPEFYYYNSNPFSNNTSDYEEPYYDEYSEPNYSAPLPPGFNEGTYDPSYYPPIDYE